MVSEIQALVRFEWAVKTSLPPPVSNYRERRSLPLPFATVNSFEAHNSLPRLGAGLLPTREQRLSSGPSDWGPKVHPHPTLQRKGCPLHWSLLSHLRLPAIPSDFLTSLHSGSLPGSSCPPVRPLPSLSFLSQLLERPVSTCCLPSSPPASSSTHCFLPSLLHRAAFTKAWPLAGSAEELDRRGRGAPRTSALDHALLPDSPLRHVPRLSPPGLGRIHRPESFVG
uniref:Uncharacterized protein n=1 Tax=Molossus molossus TaxID=27622 RepID=A0A7J8JWB1_MOLMO|nr:hypothetical protein HJG59_008110 [Molossus molossus]